MGQKVADVNESLKNKKKNDAEKLNVARTQFNRLLNRRKETMHHQVPADVVELAIKSRHTRDGLTQLNVVHRGMIHPLSRYLMLWDGLVAFCVCSSMFHVPLRIAMYWWEYDTVYKAYSISVDIISMIDVVVHFRTAFKTPSGIVSDPEIVAKHYLSTWFFIDILAAIPFDLVLPAIKSSHRKTLKMLKYFRLPKLLRMGRLLRVIRKRARYYGILINLLTFMILWHAWSCIWIGFTVDCEVTPHYCAEEHVWPMYTSTLKIMLSTLLLNDSSEEWTRARYYTLSHDERLMMGTVIQLLQIICMLTGLILLGSLFANIASVVETFNGEGQRFHTKLAKFKKEMEYFGLSKKLKDHVQMHYEYLWLNKKSFESMSLLRDPEVSDHIRREICVFLYRDVVEQVPFFFQVDSHFFVEAVCMNLVLKVFMPGDFIVCRGDASEEFFIINAGSICVLSEDGVEKLAVLSKGSFFGEIGLINGSLRSNSVIAVSVTEMCVLKKEVFTDLRNRYPKFNRLVSSVSNKRQSKIIERRHLNTALKDDDDDSTTGSE